MKKELLQELIKAENSVYLNLPVMVHYFSMKSAIFLLRFKLNYCASYKNIPFVASVAVAKIPINVRIISATNRNLEEMVQNDMFRQDLYYRLNVIHFIYHHCVSVEKILHYLPTIYLILTVADINPNVKSISPEAIKKLESYDYPGNVRELSNIIERAINMARKPVITPNDIIFSIQNQSINTK